MSTILDALRKLQREKAAAHPPRDLRGSVTDEIPLGRAPRSAGRRGLVLGLVVLLAAAGAGGAWLWKSGKLSRQAPGGVTPPAGAAQPQTAQAPSDSADSPADDEHAATEEELEQVEREALAAEQANQAAADRATAAEPEPPAPVAASPQTPPQQATQAPPAPQPEPTVDAEAEARLERERLEAAQANAAAATNAQREAEAQAAAARALPPAPPTPPVPVPVPEPAPQAESRAEVTPPAPAPVTPAPAKAAKPKPKPAAKVAKQEPARRETPPPESDSYDAAPGAAGATVFPPVRVESIRWHPIPERRVASLRFEQQNVSDAHEGDIVGGVLVYRIDPGAVEIRIGSTSRVVRPTP